MRSRPQAGVTRGALHHHFTNKAGLFEAVLRRMDAEIGDEIDAAWDPALPSWTAWRACFHQYLDAVLRPIACGCSSWKVRRSWARGPSTCF